MVPGGTSSVCSASRLGKKVCTRDAAFLFSGTIELYSFAKLLQCQICTRARDGAQTGNVHGETAATAPRTRTHAEKARDGLVPAGPPPDA